MADTTRTAAFAPDTRHGEARSAMDLSGIRGPGFEYLLDAAQRGVLFLDLLRRRGNEEIEITSRPLATVLRYDHEILMSGLSLQRPMNYALSRIVPPADVVIDPVKRPVVVVDPRAGQGPGIGGFKAESEIGDALRAGHAVYFIGFSAVPAPGQTFLDVVEGQVAFFEHVVQLHPDAPRPFAIGNCQAGYQTLMVAMLRPDLFGPCLVAGSPMSYWQGEHGKDPMRYAGGMSGGSWITTLTSDLGNGIFDGTWLILNFDKLNPSNWLWGKQYEVYANIDTGAQRYLGFEKWWGDFIELNGGELQYLVDNLFIGDKLARNQLKSDAGTVFDLRNITSPIIVFTSTQDNISPPPQSLGWIVDIYADAADIRANNQTIVYCLSHKVGHLAIFVSGKVGAKQDEEFIEMMDVIDCLPPGLYEMVLSPRPAEVQKDGFITGDWIARFETRSLDDIRALGRNGPEDDRAFATVAKVSEINQALYRAFLQPWVKACANKPMADMALALNPLRLSYTMFADANPWMALFKVWAPEVVEARRPVTDDNPYVQLQTEISSRIGKRLDVYRAARDTLTEKTFFQIYGSPWLQAWLGIGKDNEVRPKPVTTSDRLAARNTQKDVFRARVAVGGFNEALTRAVLYVEAAEHALDQRCALAFNVVRHQLMGLSLADFKQMVRDQFFILQYAPDQAVEALASMVSSTDDRKSLLAQVRSIVESDGTTTPAEQERLALLARTLDQPATRTRAQVKPTLEAASF